MTASTKVWTNGRLVTMRNGSYNLIENGCMVVEDGRLLYVGETGAMPDAYAHLPSTDLENKLVTPGLVDCHTHLVFGGNRADEFERRLQGVSYEQIAREGGGILSTVRHTRATDEAGLYDAASRRITNFLREGVTTMEIKSGYGLDLESELKMLRVGRRLGEALPMRVQTTFLGAHALHPDYKGDRASYIKLIVDKMLPAVVEEKLADAVDAFCEDIAFSLDETRIVFEAARSMNLPIKLHADQLTDGGGAALAAEFQGLSADHLEFTSEPGIKALADAGTVAVLLPGAWYTLRETKLPEIDLYRKHGAAMAIASDANPGSSPLLSLQAAMSMACTSFRMTPEEVLAGVTIHGAKALGLGGEVGSLEQGKAADFVVWPFDHPAELCYWFGSKTPDMVVFGGVNRD